MPNDTRAEHVEVTSHGRVCMYCGGSVGRDGYNLGGEVETPEEKPDKPEAAPDTNIKERSLFMKTLGSNSDGSRRSTS